MEEALGPNQPVTGIRAYLSGMCGLEAEDDL